MQTQFYPYPQYVCSGEPMGQQIWGLGFTEYLDTDSRRYKMSLHSLRPSVARSPEAYRG